jgi:hypothetical protein
MTQKIVVGPFNKSFRNDIPAFYVDNDSFPTLVNAYQWRARVKRKRGTSPICRLQRYFNSTVASYGLTISFVLVGGVGNLLIGFNLEIGGNIVPGTVVFTDSTTGNIYTDLLENGTLQGSLGGTGTINYASGTITIAGGAGDTITTASFNYYPDLPVMDIEDLNLTATQFPQTVAFDTTYSYQIVTSVPYYSYDVSFYKNPPASAALPGYIPKTLPTPVRWNGQNYQQIWSVNYEDALWATNGITQPFTTTNIGMQYKLITGITITAAGPPAIVVLTIAASGLVVGDFVFINEVVGMTGINLQTGYVIAVAGSLVTVELPNATVGGAYGSGGIAQYLTSSVAFPTKDGIRWYDGSPVSGSEFAPTFIQGSGWVNFAPPIYFGSPELTVEDLPSQIYYLVGARMIIPFKDRLLFLGPVIQSSGISGPIGPFYLQDTIIYSQNGTPYYTSSFTGNPTSGITAFFPVITPIDQSTVQSAASNAYFSDVTGYGGYITAGFAQPITTVGPNQDVLLVGFTNRQAKVVYTGNDILPFYFYIINSELGATATFGSIILDAGVITIGDRGIAITDQQSTSRIDLEIPDYVFEFDLLNNGTQRITAQRDFVNEWIYFTYPYDNEENVSSPFPNQTLFYNYRNKSWAIFNESYTTYGPFRRQNGFTWLTVGSIFPSWNAWNEPWNASSSSLLEPEIIAGNQQGFIIARADGTTGEAPSLYISAFNTSTLVVTSQNHGLNTGDFVYFLNALGLVNFNSSPAATPPSYIIWQITVLDVNNFTISSDPNLPSVIPTGIYLGVGTITRLYIPRIQSKQFPTAWEIGRKTRIGVQQYLFTTTPNAQITLQLFLSQNAETPFNAPPYVPIPNAPNNSVIYSDTLYTCQESTNLGLTPANINLQQLVPSQAQTWHRQNTSLIGDTVQVGFTLSDEQMFDPTLTNQVSEIECHGMIIDVSPSSVLS